MVDRVSAPRGVLATAVLAVLVTAGALVGAFLLRQHPSPPQAAGASTDAGGCHASNCRTIASTTIGSDTIDLLANRDGTIGSLRVRSTGQAPSSRTSSGQTPTGQGTGLSQTSPNTSTLEVPITGQGATLTAQSLVCDPGNTPACLVRGNSSQGTIGQIYLRRSTGWSASGNPYVSDGGYLGLFDVDGDNTSDVITVQRYCPGAGDGCTSQHVFAKVFSLIGKELGCTETVSEPKWLPGWPNVSPSESELHTCS